MRNRGEQQTGTYHQHKQRISERVKLGNDNLMERSDEINQQNMKIAFS
jgi:hypothetical protein